MSHSSTTASGLSTTKTVTRTHLERRNTILPLVFFLSPLATSVAPRLTPFFVAIIGMTLIGSALRGGVLWRELLPRNAAFGACLLFAAYVLLNAAWSLDPVAGLGKGALLIALIFITFAATASAAALETGTLRRAAFAFAAGAFLGALFLVFELSTDGLATRTAMNAMPILKSSSPKHVKITAGEVTSPKSVEDRPERQPGHVPSLDWIACLIGLTSAHRPIAIVLFFAAIAAGVAIFQHDSSQVALIGSGLVVMLAWKWRQLVI